MLRLLGLVRRSGGAAMTELDAVQCQSGACAAVPEQASSLITSTTRKQEKRKSDCSAVHPNNKRQKPCTSGDQGNICSSDVTNDDQENVVGASSVHEQPSRAGTGRSSLLGPLYEWLQQAGQPAAVVVAAATTAGHQQQDCPPSAVQSEQQPLQQRELGDTQHLQQSAPQQQQTEASASANTSGEYASPTSSSTPTVSQPSVAYQQHSHQQHHHHHHDPQFLQQQEQLYHQQQCSSGGTEESEDVYDDEDDFDPLAFISTLGPVEHYAMPGRPLLLPRQTRTCKQKTLVLDLDETLVHSTLDEAAGVGADFSFPVAFNGQNHTVYVRQRPHMQKFLERVAQLFEVVVFTASQKVYAEKLLNILDPQRQLIRHRIYRDSCVLVDGNYLKDLSVLGRDLARCAIVDNSPQAFGFQVANGIPIESWYDDPTDTELEQLLPFLEDIARSSVVDVRPAITTRYNLPAKVKEARVRLMNSVAAAAAAASQHERALMMGAATAAAVLQPQPQMVVQVQPAAQAQQA